MSSPPLYISGPEVRGLVSMTDLMEAMRPAFQWFSTGRVVQPLRTTTPFQVKDQDQKGYDNKDTITFIAIHILSEG